jgi:hypothetical protein
MTTDGDLVSFTRPPCIRWFDAIAASADPWQDWLTALPPLPQRGHGPLDATLEAAITATIEVADAARREMQPSTPHFDIMWQRFRQHHERLDDGADWRRRRYLVWRAAALTVIGEFAAFQDRLDAEQAHDRLAETMREFGPYAPDGSYGGGNFWRPTVRWRTSVPWQREAADPLAEYASMVLLLVRNNYGLRVERP